MILNIENLMKEIYAELGPGHSERVYHNAVEVMLREKRIRYETERIIPVVFRGHVIGNVRADIIIDGRCILEFKTIRTLGDGAELQAQNYLRLTGLNLAYLVNFPPHPDREVEIRKIVSAPLEGEFAKVFDKMHEHHRNVSADLPQLRTTVRESNPSDA